MFIRKGHHDAPSGITPPLAVSDGGAKPAIRPASASDRSLDQTLEQCLLETQRQVCRLEAVVHRLSSVTTLETLTPQSALTLIQEGNRRLKGEVDEFTLDLHTVMTMVHTPSAPKAPRTIRSRATDDHSGDTEPVSTELRIR